MHLAVDLSRGDVDHDTVVLQGLLHRDYQLQFLRPARATVHVLLHGLAQAVPSIRVHLVSFPEMLRHRH